MLDVDINFEPQYVVPRKNQPTVKKLKAEAEKADTVILATDEDREGEAIAWHLVQALGLNEVKSPRTRANSVRDRRQSKVKSIERIVFHEITKRAIEEALKNPRAIDMRRVDAQQARRILDRLVGYKLSPFLWKKVYRGLSAGRVQSVAVRLIAEREREIQAFKPQEYWTITALFEKLRKNFTAALSEIDGKPVEKLAITNEADARKIIGDLEGAEWRVANVEKKEARRNPAPPFTTSTLEQEAFRRLGFSAKQTMRLAQQLYEGIELGEGPVGLITYMRTDSLNLSADSLKDTQAFLEKEVGKEYTLPSPRQFKTKSKGAQEAHEAIRPTDPWRMPDSVKQYLEPRPFKLYNLIWRRFIATQMPPAIFDSTAVEIAASQKSNVQSQMYTFRATGQMMKFDGFLKVYPIKFTETELPALEHGEKLDLQELKPEQHFTQPLPRYTEASLVKTLESYGIGRPSTYAPTLSTIQDRGYVERYERKFLKPTEVGLIVNDMLVEHFPEVVDVEFTAKMEEELDEIARGEKEWQPVIREFYEPFAKQLLEKYGEVEKHEISETTEEICEKCGKQMVIKLGRFGKFLACSGFPECRNTKNLQAGSETIGMKCPKCSEGDIVVRRTRRGKVFFGCSRYPECDYASWTDPRKNKP